jgi:hypothetical protein
VPTFVLAEEMVGTLRFAHPTGAAPIAPTYFIFPASFFTAALIDAAASS